ncbi:MAG: phosphoenolpyruvate carboxylase [Cryomorphaceae bacterium]|jgi:phosphoenolpyruvate carboxylase|nr:phosphoenolpyruvate carboxylase [Cryomorphaceae bacterium]MBT3503893.1 phosphoenolpyruvate carboxylase [Cryomorphaceae bacterium]MBT4518186.1 phosphoenolpyruvate carboxylase [Cryomorphaceae bacterium]MBT6214022.1 phosphoenolpyruvate carboxylase [Cryomorphaceae bacterium]MBT6318274.1 phosphoenolpyruvate carboxylase [Cryomorphaceae bacterium]
MNKLTKKERFQENVLSRFHVYNSIFATLPYDSISDTGNLLPIFTEHCKLGYSKKLDPKKIVQDFFSKYCEGYTKDEEISLIFRFIQYIERQVVLFDAIEDASFTQVNNMGGVGTLRNLKELVESSNKKKELKKYLRSFKIRPVLTAHPTQFYPGSVLGIITDLANSIEKNDLTEIKNLLSQLGKTPFFKQKKPTPYDEAVSLSWYLENVFYYSVSNIFKYVKSNIFDNKYDYYDLISVGFWPGGDRDGNPYVTSEITSKTAKKLRSDIIKNYYRDIRFLRRKLTFKKIEDVIIQIEDSLWISIFETNKDPKIKLDVLKEKLNFIKETLINEHKSLFLDELQDLIDKVNIFGYHFATLDIRQDSTIHSSVFNEVINNYFKKELSNKYESQAIDQKIQSLSLLKGKIDSAKFKNEITKSTIESIELIKQIQESNGEKGCHRYIISNNNSSINIFEVFTMIRLTLGNKFNVDVVPLFESVSDLENAGNIMDKVYSNKLYREHIIRRGNVQTVMLGFSDGTKDGGYLTANWSILKAKESLTKVSRKFGIKVIFFDGRGGPPARGGGNTHQFYSSLGDFIESDEIQLTVQGQTISSNFGTIKSSQYNMEQLISSGIKNRILSNSEVFNKKNRKTIEKLSSISYSSYKDFKSHPSFIPYLEKMSTIKYYSKTNIGSRPSKRGVKGEEFNFDKLRAIPFVGSWNQLKQNVPGFFGLGTSINYFYEKNRIKDVKLLYQEVPFFRALVSNSMMSLTKSFFELTSYMSKDQEFGEFWKIIHDEYVLTKKMLLKISNFKELMENEPANKLSIETRENIVMPLITIQQYALQIVKEIESGDLKKTDKSVFEKIITRSLYGNINASRNSA